MFGYRTDGEKVKDLPAFFRLIPHIMKKRSDAHVYYQEDISLEPLDNYIDAKSKEGINISLITFSNNYNRFTKMYNEAIMISRRIYITDLFRKSIVHFNTTLEDISD